METNEKSFINRFGVAILAALTGFLIRSALTPVLGSHVPFSTLYPTIVFSALFGGFWAGTVTTLLSALAADYFFVGSRYSFSTTYESLVQTFIFAATGILISWVASERGRIQLRLQTVETEAARQKRENKEALRESEERALLAQKYAGIGIWEWNPANNEVDWSEGIFKLIGIRPHSVKPSLETWEKRVFPEDLERTHQNVLRAIENGDNETYNEFRVNGDDRKMRWIASQGQIIRDEKNQIVKMRGVNYDITDRKESELQIKNLNQELNRRVQELQTIFDIAPVGIAVAQDASCNVITANPALAEILGVKSGDNISINSQNVEGVPYKHLKNGRELMPDELPMQRAVRERKTIVGEETDILRADGKTVTIYGYAAPVFDEHQTIISCIAAHIDISERKKDERERQRQLATEQLLRREAEEANRLKDEFLATVSHELRTPLNAILGWVSMLRDGRFPEETQMRAHEAIERSAKSQSQLIEDLLDVSRIISGKVRLEVEPVELNSIIENAVETVRPAADAKNIKLRAETGTESKFVSGDADRLQQIVWNLLSNAIKFTAQNGTVEVLLRDADFYTEITVKDSGRGISKEFLPFVFDRFRQADGSITRHFTGLGLGLAIVRHLVELHGGTVSAESDGEGKGAAFTVKLPIATQAANAESLAPIAVHRSDSNYPALDGVKVLVVDDEEDTREILKMTFEKSRAAVEIAASVSEALEIFKEWQPQVIVSDVGMPDEDGYSLLRKVREWERENRHETPVQAIALTAYAHEKDRRNALAAGFQKHITKPVEPVEVSLLIADLLVNEKTPNPAFDEQTVNSA